MSRKQCNWNPFSHQLTHSPRFLRDTEVWLTPVSKTNRAPRDRIPWSTHDRPVLQPITTRVIYSSSSRLRDLTIWKAKRRPPASHCFDRLSVNTAGAKLDWRTDWFYHFNKSKHSTQEIAEIGTKNNSNRLWVLWAVIFNGVNCL